MKKLLVLLFSALLLSSVCFADGASVTALSDQTKVTNDKKQDVPKRSVKPKVKRSITKGKKKNRSTKKKEIVP